MSWNYRILAKKSTINDEITFGVYSVYYDKNGKPNSCSVYSASTDSETVNELDWTLQQMLNAFKKPILWYDTFEEYNEDLEDTQFSISIPKPSKCGSCIYLKLKIGFSRKHYCSNINSPQFNSVVTKNTKSCEHGSR